MRKRISFPAYLEVQTEKGPAFCSIDRLLVSPELQERCLEKRKLNRILRLIEEDPTIAKEIHDKWG